jgi:hypothetical protein
LECAYIRSSMNQADLRAEEHHEHADLHRLLVRERLSGGVVHVHVCSKVNTSV